MRTWLRKSFLLSNEFFIIKLHLEDLHHIGMLKFTAGYHYTLCKWLKGALLPGRVQAQDWIRKGAGW